MKENYETLLDALTNEMQALHKELQKCKEKLSQEPCDDAISRQAVIDAIEDDNRNGHYSCFATNNDAQCFKDVIRKLPSVTPQQKMEPCEDMVSRDAMWDVLQRLYGTEGELVEELMSLPPVLPMPKIGKWIPVEAALPEVGSEVLVCYEFKKHRSVYIANFYGDGKFHGLDDEYLTTEGRKYRKAVAWMPMPTPPNKSEIPTGSEGSKE